MRYQRAEGVLHQVVEGRAMLIAPAGEDVVVLNATGTAVWDALADGGDVGSLAESVRAAHAETPLDTVAADVAAFLAELDAAGLVRPE